MKKIFITLFILFCFCKNVSAINVSVESLTEVNDSKETTNFAVKILKDTKITEEITFKKDSVVNMDIVKIVPARSCKRNAYMILKPIFMADDELYTPLDESNIEAKTTTIKVIDKQDLKQNLGKNIKNAGINAGMKAATTMVPGSGQILQVSKGLIKPEEGKTRLQSAAGNLSDSLPTKHLKKGKDLDIKEGDKLVLNFYKAK